MNQEEELPEWVKLVNRIAKGEKRLEDMVAEKESS
jgi:hypothetical protein